MKFLLEEARHRKDKNLLTIGHFIEKVETTHIPENKKGFKYFKAKTIIVEEQVKTKFKNFGE